MTTEQVSPDLVESTRNSVAVLESALLRRIASLTGVAVAKRMGVSESTVSRLKEPKPNGDPSDIHRFAELLNSLNLRLCPADAVVISQKELGYYKLGAARFLVGEVEKDPFLREMFHSTGV